MKKKLIIKRIFLSEVLVDVNSDIEAIYIGNELLANNMLSLDEDKLLEATVEIDSSAGEIYDNKTFN